MRHLIIWILLVIVGMATTHAQSEFLVKADSIVFTPYMAVTDWEVSPAKPDVLQEELSAIEKYQQNLSEADLTTILYWNAGPPAYRWHQIITEIGHRYPKNRNGGRMAVLHLAIYDACVAIYEQKMIHQQGRPFEVNDLIRPYLPVRPVSGYLCERSAAAATAAEIIKYYFPDAGEEVERLALEAAQSRINSGLQYPSDITQSMELGRKVAATYIEYARHDRTDLLWEGQVPTEPGYWSGDPGKKDPMKGQWKPYTLTSPDQFRPPPPPDFESDMEELRRFNKEHRVSDIAWSWKASPLWDDILDKKIFEYQFDEHPVLGAYVQAVYHVARYDAIIAAWEGKYHYWGIRPFQYDPTFQPILVETPNFPGYPAGHTSVAGSLSTVLSYFFPRDKALFEQMALECSESRFEGGVHFRVDNEVGLMLGRQVGAQVIDVLGALLKD